MINRNGLALFLVAVLLIMVSVIYAPGILADNGGEDSLDTPGILADNGDKLGVRVFRVPDTDKPGGTAAGSVGDLIEKSKFKLKRTPTGVSMKIKTSDLPPGAYTLWWAIDNDNDPDTGGAPGAPLVTGVEAVRQAVGGLVGPNGKGKFEATLSAGPFPPDNKATVAFNVATADFDPMEAGIAVVIRYHGPVIPGAVLEQTSLFAGGCSNVFLMTNSFPGAFPGAEVCYDPQVTEFDRP